MRWQGIGESLVGMHFMHLAAGSEVYMHQQRTHELRRSNGDEATHR